MAQVHQAHVPRGDTTPGYPPGPEADPGGVTSHAHWQRSCVLVAGL